MRLTRPLNEKTAPSSVETMLDHPRYCLQLAAPTSCSSSLPFRGNLEILLLLATLPCESCLLFTESIQKIKTVDNVVCRRLARWTSDTLKLNVRLGSHRSSTPLGGLFYERWQWLQDKRAPVWEYTASVSAGRRRWHETQSTVTPPDNALGSKNQASCQHFPLPGCFFLFQLRGPWGELPATLPFPLAVLFHGKFASCLL